MKTHHYPKGVDFFRFNGRVYHLKDFCKMFRGKCVKIERIISRTRSESFFFSAIYRYFNNAFVAFDDCRTIFARGVPPEMLGLMSRINHAGKSYCKPENIGIDVALIFHGFKAVNPETYNYVNLIVQFRTVFEPTLPKDAEEIEPVILDNYAKLIDAKKYSNFEYDINAKINKLNTP